jgi:hypothetical protein
MFRLQTNSQKFSTLALHTSRKLFTMLSLAGVLLLGSAAIPAGAQQGQSSAQFRTASIQQGKLNIQQLGDALTSYGKNTVTNNGQTYYSVNCGKGQWKSSIIISLSPNGNVIWMTIDMTQLPARTSPAALESLLKKNLEIGPSFFAINGHSLRLSAPVPNNNLSASTVKAYVEDLVNTAVDTMPLWDQKTLGGN